MSTPTDTDLGLKDIQFLKSVQDICANPEEYPHTDAGTLPASKTALREVTDLDQSAINYRLKPDRSPLAGEVGAGYIRVESPVLNGDGSWGPKSAELTEKGAKALDKALEAHSLDSASAADEELRDRVDDLEQQVDSLVEAVQALRDEVAEFNSNSLGALSENKEKQVEGVIEAVPAQAAALQAIGLTKEELNNFESIDQDTVRERVRETLGVEGATNDGDTQQASLRDANDSP